MSHTCDIHTCVRLPCKHMYMNVYMFVYIYTYIYIYIYTHTYINTFKLTKLTTCQAIHAQRDTSQEDPLDVEANSHDLNFINLDGNIACLVNGAGTSLSYYRLFYRALLQKSPIKETIFSHSATHHSPILRTHTHTYTHTCTHTHAHAHAHMHTHTRTRNDTLEWMGKRLGTNSDFL